jgi:membrane-bound lytic murein transglycosylase D
MRFITNFWIACLAELIKWSSPWYIWNVVYGLFKWIRPYGMFALTILLFVLLPTPPKNPTYKGFSPQNFLFFLTPEEFERYFPTPKELKHHVELWADIFARYTTRQVVIHDSWYFQVVYAVVDLDEAININAIISKYRRILHTLARKEKHHDLGALTAEEEKVYKLFENIVEKDKFNKAACRPIRAQSGQREKFIEAIRRSGLYQQRFSQIFHAHNLPIELTRLPFVESFFNYHAYSRAGAAGIWQFIPPTAKRYGLQINGAVDERYDPFKSAVSAAKLLKANYEIFESWPLAITAYNHGPTGLLKAIQQTGTSDFGKIVRTYQGSNFGFYSRNYYAQFLAVVQIMRNPKKYFDDIERFPPLQYDEVMITRRMFIDEIATMLSISKEELVTLNRDLKRAVVQSKSSMPKNFVLKLPYGKKQEFLSTFQEQAAID